MQTLERAKNFLPTRRGKRARRQLSRRPCLALPCLASGELWGGEKREKKSGKGRRRKQEKVGDSLRELKIILMKWQI